MTATAVRARDPGDPRIIVWDEDDLDKEGDDVFIANWDGSAWSEGFGDIGTFGNMEEEFAEIEDTNSAENLLSAARAALSLNPVRDLNRSQASEES